MNHINNKKNFHYNQEEEYNEKEHIGIEIGDVLRDMHYNIYYTRDILLNEAREIIKKESGR